MDFYCTAETGMFMKSFNMIYVGQVHKVRDNVPTSFERSIWTWESLWMEVTGQKWVWWTSRRESIPNAT